MSGALAERTMPHYRVPDGGHYEPTGRSFATQRCRDRRAPRQPDCPLYRDYFDRQTMTQQLGLD
jgi:hypothetical protein